MGFIAIILMIWKWLRSPASIENCPPDVSDEEEHRPPASIIKYCPADLSEDEEEEEYLDDSHWMSDTDGEQLQDEVDREVYLGQGVWIS